MLKSFGKLNTFRKCHFRCKIIRWNTGKHVSSHLLTFFINNSSNVVINVTETAVKHNSASMANQEVRSRCRDPWETHPLLLLGLRDELFVLSHQLLHLLHQLLFALLLHLLALPLHLRLSSGHSLAHGLPLLLLHLGPQLSQEETFRSIEAHKRTTSPSSESGAHLLQRLPDHPLRLPLVVGLHHLLDVVEHLSVLLVAHVLAGAVAVGLGATVKCARWAAVGLLGLRGHWQLLGRLRRRRHRDLLAGAYGLHLRLGVLAERRSVGDNFNFTSRSDPLTMVTVLDWETKEQKLSPNYS